MAQAETFPNRADASAARGDEAYDGRPYGAVSRLNHWVAALVMLGMLGLGFFIAYGGLEQEARAPFLDLHKSVGTLFLLFALWRVGWRLWHGFAPEEPGVPRWQAWAARATHWALLAGVLAMPLSGVLMTIFGGRAIEVFGLATFPAGPEVAWLDAAAGAVHDVAGYLIAALIALHVAAALKHHLVDRDDTLRRMLPTPKRRFAHEPDAR